MIYREVSIGIVGSTQESEGGLNRGSGSGSVSEHATRCGMSPGAPRLSSSRLHSQGWQALAKPSRGMIAHHNQTGILCITGYRLGQGPTEFTWSGVEIHR